MKIKFQYNQKLIQVGHVTAQNELSQPHLSFLLFNVMSFIVSVTNLLAVLYI